MKIEAFSSRYRVSRQPSRGLTLVELLVGMVIGLFLTAGIVTVFVGTKQGYRLTEAMSRLQENGRFAVEYLSRDLRQAGYRDITDSDLGPLVNSIEGWSGTNPDPSALTNYVANTDVLRVTYAEPNTSPAVIHNVLYYIGTPSSSTEPGLRRRIDANDSQELIEGIQDMQILYGLDTDGDGNLDSYASTTSNWSQVIAVRVNLLLGSPEGNVAESSMSLPFQKNDGSFFTATDRRVYQAFTATIALRNRLS